MYPATIIIRHRRENLQKCSLRGLENRLDMQFYSYPCSKLPQLNGYLMLAMEAPVLDKKDSNYGILLLDATWRYAQRMNQFVLTQFPQILTRSLPTHFRTAYPRRQEDCQDPERGLASLEALFIAYKILGRDGTGLLDSYYWKEQFLEKNKQFIDS